MDAAAAPAVAARPAWLRAAPLAALVLVGTAALLFDVTLSSRLPSAEDWAQAAAVLRGEARRGDAVQVWPPWAERARLVVDAMPVLLEERLDRADYVGVARLWLLALPDAPHAGVANAEAALRGRGAVPTGERMKLGALALQAWDLRTAPLAAQLLPAHADEAHEVDYVARRCARVPIGPPQAPARLRVTGAAGTTLHLRAGIIGERAYDARPAVRVESWSNDQALGVLTVPRTLLREDGWRRLDVALPASVAAHELTLELRISSPDPQRSLCVAAWTTR